MPCPLIPPNPPLARRAYRIDRYLTPHTMPLITAEAIFRFVSENGHIAMETRARGRLFTVHAIPGGLAFTIQNGNHRFESLAALQGVCDEFNLDNCDLQSDYRDITWNASYVLAVIDRCLNP